MADRGRMQHPFPIWEFPCLHSVITDWGEPITAWFPGQQYTPCFDIFLQHHWLAWRLGTVWRVMIKREHFTERWMHGWKMKTDNKETKPLTHERCYHNLRWSLRRAWYTLHKEKITPFILCGQNLGTHLYLPYPNYQKFINQKTTN